MLTFECCRGAMAGQVPDSQLLPQSQFTETETGTVGSDNTKKLGVSGERSGPASCPALGLCQ